MWRTGPLVSVSTHASIQNSRHIYALKRPLDVILGLTLGLVSLPIVILCAAISACLFRAWPFFTQLREGQHGRQIRFIKIRSLPTTAPAYADREELDQVSIGRWGRFIRRHHLDELPQFWQVVGGSMSLVGPRPMISSICERMDDDFRHARHTVRPGITGLWQISEAGSRLVLDATHYDEHYIRHASLSLDAWILWRTASRLFGAAPAASHEVAFRLGEPFLESHGLLVD